MFVNSELLIERIEEAKRFLGMAGIKSMSENFKECWEDPFKNWQSFVKAIESSASLIIAIVQGIEKASNIGAGIINGGKVKLHTAVGYLLELVKFPWYLKFFKTKILEVLVSVTVAFLNIFKKWEE